jgi:hypothetical protein
MLTFPATIAASNSSGLTIIRPTLSFHDYYPITQTCSISDTVVMTLFMVSFIAQNFSAQNPVKRNFPVT